MNKWRILQIARFPCRMQWTIARICDNETDNPVFESNCPVKFPTIDRKSMQAVRTVACCQRKNVDDDFVNEVVDGKPV